MGILLVVAVLLLSEKSPGLRDHFGIVYDPLRNKVVIHGGNSRDVDGKYNYVRDTWEWDTKSWVKKDTGTVPTRSSHLIVYDRYNDISVLFGGTLFPGVIHDDTWLWNGEYWRKAGVSGPSARYSPGMGYDEGRKKVVLFSGCGPGDAYPRDTWEWDGKTWNEVAIEGPMGRIRAAMFYDPTTKRTMMFGGFIKNKGATNELWAYDGTRWTMVEQPDIRPAPRSNMSMVYDRSRRVAVLYSGSIDDGDLWEWDGQLWKRISFKNGPGRLEVYGMVYHDQLKKVLVYGGRSDARNTKEDFWSWDGKKWERIH